MAASHESGWTGGWFTVALWTVFGTLSCVAVSVTYNWLMFSGMAPEARWQGVNSGVVLPLVLAGPSFFILMVMMRKLAIANRRLDELASLDGLTGCLNRRAFTACVERHLEQIPHDANAPGGAFIMVDADHFKAVNDRFGHDKGDEALQLIAGAIRSVLREGDALGRLGGEEFGIHLPHSGRQAAVDVAERVRAAVAAVGFAPGGRRHPLSVSVGCVHYREPAGFGELFVIADRRLYKAKRTGRNRIVVDEPPPLVPEAEEMLAAG